MIYQIGNIFCLEISGGGLPESVRGGECPPPPPLFAPVRKLKIIKERQFINPFMTCVVQKAIASIILFLFKSKKREKTQKSTNLKIFWDIISHNVQAIMRNYIPE